MIFEVLNAIEYEVNFRVSLSSGVQKTLPNENFFKKW